MPVIFKPVDGAHSQLSVNGPMTIYEAVEHKRDLLDALAASTGLELDLSEVDEIDTAGVQLLLLARREGLKTGKPVRVVGKSAALLEVLDRYGLGAYFQESVASH